MKTILSNHAFHAGFWFGLIFMLVLNIYDFVTSYEGWDQYGTFGVPFSVKDGGKLFDHIIWPGLFGDILFTVLFSFALGVLLRFAWIARKD